MSGNKSELESDHTLNTMRGIAHAAWTAWAALMEVMPADDGTGGTEASYTGYGRVDASAWAAPSDEVGGRRQMPSSADWIWPEMNDAANNVAGICLFDANVAGAVRRLGTIAGGWPIATGKTPRIVGGAATVIED